MKPTTTSVNNEYLALGFLRKPTSLHNLDFADVLLFMFSLAWLKQFFEKPMYKPPAITQVNGKALIAFDVQNI